MSAVGELRDREPGALTEVRLRSMRRWVQDDSHFLHAYECRELLDALQERLTVTDEMVERLARSKYERFDSHFSMPGGLTWDEYVAEDPAGARFYHDDAKADLTAALNPQESS